MPNKINLIINLHIAKQTHRNEGALIVLDEGMHLVKKCDRSHLDAKVFAFLFIFPKTFWDETKFRKKKKILFVIKSFQGFALIFFFSSFVAFLGVILECNIVGE